MYRVFTRVWWKEATEPGWPGNLEPCAASKKTTIHKNVKTIEEATELCRAYNKTHPPGRYLCRAEFEED